jgi:hypothetical protein
MIFYHRLLVLNLIVLLSTSGLPSANACGPSFIEPVFVFNGSPDLPFSEFAAGKLGIVKPQFGRKTLVIAYRYLNERPFGREEQKALVEALQGQAPEDEGNDAVKIWVATRKGLLKEGEQLPQIYAERQYGGYDFFPNCTKNAFEVATETLRDRIASYGADNRDVRTWLVTQDAVFQNCGGGENKLVDLGVESAKWLRKDRDYQIGAALLYSLDFAAARERFEQIARDSESPWQQTADYLVARTLVRQASFAKDEASKRRYYEQAELHLQALIEHGGKFSNASQRMLGLVKYRLRPQERVKELAGILETQSGNENLRQDLIDYVWLLDKFEAQVWQAEAERKKAQKRSQQDSDSDASHKQVEDRYEAIERGDLISITLDQKKFDGTPDYTRWFHLDFKPDASEDEILQRFEIELGKKFTSEEAAHLKEEHARALENRKLRLNPNQKWRWDSYEGYPRGDESVALDMIPDFLSADELSDWILTLESDDQAAYSHAFVKWRNSDSRAWLVAALTKAQSNSPGVVRLLRAAETVTREAPAFASVSFHRIRLLAALGHQAEARKLLDDIISWQTESLPVSAQNQVREQRMRLALSVSEFLRFAQRKPVTFYDEGRFGSLSGLLESEKYSWADWYGESKEAYDKAIDDRFRRLLPWNDRFTFDDATVEILNWHFPLTAMKDAASDSSLPRYLRRRLLLAVWTRAVLLHNDEIAEKVAPDLVKLSPQMSQIFVSYLQAKTDQERHYASLYILLKEPTLSPFVAAGLPVHATSEDLNYYFESSWWCSLAITEYNNQGNEVPKIVAAPTFLTAEQLATATSERARLRAIGDGKSYLGKRVLEWAKASAADERVPEALFIAIKANDQYKYGCRGWEFDQETRTQLESILRENYPESSWTLQLNSAEQ